MSVAPEGHGSQKNPPETRTRTIVEWHPVTAIAPARTARAAGTPGGIAGSLAPAAASRSVRGIGPAPGEDMDQDVLPSIPLDPDA